jgi:hypothetical protein
MEHSIAGIIDRVEVLETGARATDHDKLPDDTREDDYDEEDEMEEVDDEEPFNPPPRPPPRWHHRDDQRAHGAPRASTPSASTKLARYGRPS